MCERRHGADRELPLEPEPDIDQHQRKGCNQRRDPVPKQFLRNLGAHRVVAEYLLVSYAQRLFQRFCHQFVGRARCAFGLVCGRQRLKFFPENGRICFAVFHDHDTASIGADRAVHIGVEWHRLTHTFHSYCVRLLQLHHCSTGKVDTEVETPRREEEDGRCNQHR